MTTKILPVVILAGALAVAACASKKDVLPPEAWQKAPPAEAPIGPASTVPPAEGVESSVPPGSQAALVQAAGSDTVHFAFDSYALDDEARGILAKQAGWLARNGGVSVTVEGHTDPRGTREYNLALGERRANAARNFLAAQGVAGSRLAIISYGKERPAVEGDTEAAWAADRRAVTVVTGGR